MIIHSVHTASLNKASDVDLCTNLSGQIEMRHVSSGVAGAESFGTRLFQDVAYEPCCFSTNPKDSCWQRKMRRRIQWRGSKMTLCNLKRRELMSCYPCFSPFLLQRLSWSSWCQSCTNAEVKPWQRVQSDHFSCFGTERSASSRQGGETVSGHCNFLSLSVVRRSFGVCRCFVYIRILRHAACWYILYKTALEMDSW